MQRQLRVLDTASETSGDSVNERTARVAFATSDLKKVDQHFGSSERFAIYALGPEQATLLEVAEFGRLKQDGNENKLLEKFVLLDGCVAVYCLAVGPSAVRQLVGLGIQPVRLAERTPIAKIIDDIQNELRKDGNSWIARAMARAESRSAQRFEQMEEEGWEE